MSLRAERRGKTRVGVVIVALVVGLGGAWVAPKILDRMYPEPQPKIVFESSSPDGKCTVAVVENPLGREGMDSACDYVVSLVQADKKPLPGAALSRSHEGRLANFTAEWSDKGVEVYAGGSTPVFLGYGRVVDGRQEWKVLRAAQISDIEDATSLLKRRVGASTKPGP